MTRHLKAVFRFRVDDDPEDLKPPLKLLLRTLRIIRIRDPRAELKVTDDDGPILHHDADGD